MDKKMTPAEMKAMKPMTKKSTDNAKKAKKAPSPAQLKAREAFTKMVRDKKK
jgi:hypothetical protein